MRRWPQVNWSKARKHAPRRGAKIDSEIVENAAAIPYDWEKSPRVEGKEVHGVAMLWNEGAWDYSFTSLK